MRNPCASSSGTACCSKVGMKRGPWTPEEDEVLASHIKREGEGRWRTLPKRAGLLRCGKSCRLRWMNYLRPDVKRGHIAPDEEDLILRLHRLLGNRWSLIAGRIPGRTDNEIKNYWNTHLSKKLISQGIDPRTHKPLNTNNPNTLSSLKVQDETPSAPAAAAPNPNPSPGPSTNLSPGPSSNHNIHPNYHHLYTAVGAAEGFSEEVMLQNNQNSYFSEMDVDFSDRWRISEGFTTMNSQRSDREISNEEGIIDYNTSDDVFSFFLNTLINEDMILQQQQEHQQDYNYEYHGQNNSNCNQVAQLDPPISSAPWFSLGE